MSAAPPDSVKVRRFPPPWRIDGNSSAFWVVDSEGKRFGYCYFRDELEGAHQVHMLTRDEALRIARNIAKLPDMLSK